MAHMTRATRASGQCWCISEYFMLKQCLENKGEGLLHARISSKNSNANLWDRTGRCKTRLFNTPWIVRPARDSLLFVLGKN